MDCFIKKIFNNKSDEFVHLQFQKFSRGTFKGRAMMKAKHGPKGYTLWTTAEYANELVRSVAEKLGHEKANVTGVIVSTADLEGKVPSTSKKQFMGIKQYIVSGSMSGTELVELCNKVPEAFFALSFNAGTIELKIKPKAPKSAKPSTSEAGPKIDFCTLKTTDESLVKQFIFDAHAFKELEIKHSFVIEDIILPHKYSSPDEMRRLAQRKGKIIRESTVDGKAHKTEANFVA